jgi:hypothetical protein
LQMKAFNEIWQERARSLRFDDDVVEGVKGGCPDEVTYFQEPPCLTQGPFLSALGFALRGFSTQSLLHSGKAEESLPICCSEKEP